MAQILFANNAATTLATAISSSTTSIVVTSGGGALFPNPGTNQYFLATLSPATPGAQPQEIVRVTARSTDTFTVTRAQEGTIAQSWGTGAIVQNLLTAATVGTFPQTVPFAGNPNGNIAGAAGVGNLPPSTVWDYSNNLLYVCTTSGTASTAQWSAQAPLTSPQFNGSPTVPNVGFGNSSTLAANTAFVAAGLAPKADTTYVNSQVATRTTYSYVDSGLALKTAFSDFVADTSPTGYVKIPVNYSGFPNLIIQWGVFSGTTGSLSAAGVAEINPINVTWSIPFTYGPVSIVCSPRDVDGANLQEIAWVGSSPTTTGGSFALSCRQAGTAMNGNYIVMGF
jgi:hypothetical protein